MYAVASQDEQALRAQLRQSRERLDGLVRDLHAVDSELDGLSTGRQQHRAPADARDKVGKAHQYAANDAAQGEGILAGTSADVEVILDRREDALRIPSSSVAEGGKVLVVEDGILVAVVVEVGLEVHVDRRRDAVADGVLGGVDRAGDGGEVDESGLSKEELDYVKTTRVLLGHKREWRGCTYSISSPVSL